jgi:hypothetical protein
MTTITHSLLSDLRAKAEAANECDHTGWHDESDIYGSLSVTFGAYHGLSQDASCIAAASPSVVLALLDRIKALSEGAEALKTGGSAYHMLAMDNARLRDEAAVALRQHASLCGEIEQLKGHPTNCINHPTDCGCTVDERD